MGTSTLRLVVLLTGILVSGGTAHASSFTVNPIKVLLSGKEQSALLTLHNQSTEELRFKVVVKEWKQSPQGEMKLSETKDVVVYPALLSLPPNGERKLRVGTTVQAGTAERAYRVFVEELPPLRSGKETSKSEVRVLTKMGIPIFIRPDKPTASARVEGLSLAKGSFSFGLANQGNVHLLVQAVRVRGLDGRGAASYEKELEGWYVLAGENRIWQQDIPPDACAKTRTLSVEIQTGDGKLDGKLDVVPSSCSR